MLKLFKTIILIVLIFLQVLFLKEFVIGFYKVPSNSMQPTIQNNSLVIISKMAYKFLDLKINDPKNGDIVAFRKNGKLLIKRVAATPNQKIFFNSKNIYMKKPKKIKTDSISLDDNEFFLVGDNLTNSLDSRTFGPIKLDSIHGKMIFKF